MPDSRAMKAERRLQPMFRKSQLFQLLIFGAITVLFHFWTLSLPDRAELGLRMARLAFEPIAFDPQAFGPLRVAGAWKVTSDDPRFGGISALAFDGEDLLALTDTGVLVRFARPAGASGVAVIRELPDGPGDPRFRSRRDSEALLRDPQGRGWWVAFENRNELWLYDRDFTRALRRIAFGAEQWPTNRGIEGLAGDGGDLLLFPEAGKTVVRFRGGSGRKLSISNGGDWISDAATLPDGRLLVLERQPTLLGLSNALAILERSETGYRRGSKIRLGVSALDNLEAVAVERTAGGTIRLWLMTDDNLRRPMRTLLIALDWPERLKRPAAP